MKPHNIVAHRGLWEKPADKNSLKALSLALDEGFSVETDFRDCNGYAVISHDPPLANSELTASIFFETFVSKASKDVFVALNVKADGLQAMLTVAMNDAGVDKKQVFAFDMSVPDAFGYTSIGFPIFSRISEYETSPLFEDRTGGIWLDNFNGHFDQLAAASEYLLKGHRVVFVSPELHRRPYEIVWKEILENGLHLDPKFAICTDFPREAMKYFGEDK